MKVELDHKWAPYQAEALRAFWSGHFDLVVLRTGYGGGKSVLGSRIVHRAALRVAGDHLVLAPKFSHGGPATYRVFFEELPGTDTVPDDGDGDPENSPIIAGYNRNKRRLTYENGAIVRLGSADKWNRYAGTEFNTIWADEPAHYDNTSLYDLHEMLVSRQRTDAGPNVTLWTSTGSGYGQYYDITERQVTADDEPLPWADRMRVIVANSLNNPFLSDSAKAKLRAQFEGTPREEQALSGGFSAAQGLAYSEFSRPRHVVPYEQVKDRMVGGWRIYGYDAGWNDPRVVVEVGRTHYGQFVVLDCFYESGTHIEAVTGADGWMADRPKGAVYCEHEPAHIQKFRGAGWPAQKAEKSLDEGIPHVRHLLESDDEGRVGLLVCERCTPLIQEFLSYEEDDVGKSDVDDHALDASRYALFTHDSAPTNSGEGGGVTGGSNRSVAGGGSSKTDVSKFF
ncbi:MAG: hypothetical protein ABEN55_13330 [Bradymonadaceae bacterium]